MRAIELMDPLPLSGGRLIDLLTLRLPDGDAFPAMLAEPHDFDGCMAIIARFAGIPKAALAELSFRDFDRLIVGARQVIANSRTD